MVKLCELLKSVREPVPSAQVGMVASAPGFLTREECERIVSISGSLQGTQGQIRVTEESSVNTGTASTEPSTRHSEIKWLPPIPEAKWVYDKLDAAVTLLNQAYHYDLTGFELLQVATYTNGGHYDWHIDLGAESESTRKLSLSVQLSDPGDYDGGDLQFLSTPVESTRGIGTVVAFPSFLAHRVFPVTRGTRRSLVAWVHGPAFR